MTLGILSKLVNEAQTYDKLDENKIQVYALDLNLMLSLLIVVFISLTPPICERIQSTLGIPKLDVTSKIT